jgi:uncharacterized membrane protein (UPF0127 family)
MADRHALTPLAVFALSLLVWLGVGCQTETAAASGTQVVEIAGETFELELALTDAQRYQGLSGRESIPEDGGMLFVFQSEAERTFVMRDCLVPIDILFLGPTGKVLSAYAMEVEPPGRSDLLLKKYRSRGRSALVIELAGGTIERLGIEVGDRVELPIRELKLRAR